MGEKCEKKVSEIKKKEILKKDKPDKPETFTTQILFYFTFVLLSKLHG